VLPRISPGDLRPEQLTIAVGVDLQTSSWGLILRTRELLFVGPGSLFVGLALDPEGESMHFGFPAAVYPWLTFGVQTVTGATTATVAWFVARISKRQAETNRQKLRLDLYERRYAVYREARRFRDGVTLWNR
jgi:hypothetical protein